jgi:hypothetical protein
LFTSEHERIESARGRVQVRKNLRLVKPGERTVAVSKEMHRAESIGDDLLWMTAPLDEKASEYTWTPSKPPELALRPRLRRRKIASTI